eukprot:TRINITY_DN1459_c0_g1_i1.p3 TRINITY_DN1459_c0_g1~~TRINITY_DN1459_c0_g1_i1.p3  ORF type:complete len:100 (-),score=5.02 TRINITY_DN1459_c0_g1_i1:161-460(-)
MSWALPAESGGDAAPGGGSRRGCAVKGETSAKTAMAEKDGKEHQKRLPLLFTLPRQGTRVGQKVCVCVWSFFLVALKTKEAPLGGRRRAPGVASAAIPF